MAFRKKAEYILKEQPDILIIPECENQDRLSLPNTNIQCSDNYWYGHNPHKGIGVFTFNGLKIILYPFHNPEFKFILPLQVFNEKINVTVLAVWAQKPMKHDCYTEQIWNAVHFYNELLEQENVIIAGDFNSNSMWDKPNRIYNHTNLVSYLKNKNIISSYHYFYNQIQGKEKHHTLFMNRNIKKPYHIDYCFASQNLIGKLANVEVGTYEIWTKYSDHKPLIITFDS